MKAKKRDITYLQSFNKSFGDLHSRVTLSNFRKRLFDDFSRALCIPANILTAKYKESYSAHRNEMIRFNTMKDAFAEVWNLALKEVENEFFSCDRCRFESMTEEVEC